MKLSPKQREALDIVAEGLFYPLLVKEEDGWHARWRAIGVDNDWVDEYVRESAMTRLTEDAEDERHETLHDAWMMALRSRTGLVRWDEAECESFAAELRAWSGSAEADVAARRSLSFDFVSPPSERSDVFTLRCETPRGKRGLKALGLAAYVYGPIRGLKATDGTARQLAVVLTRVEAENFVRRGAKDLRDAGYVVTGVEAPAEVTASAELEAGDGTLKRPPAPKLTIRVAGEEVTAAELRFLLDQGSSLVFFRDRWIEVDRSILKEALRALEKGVDGTANVIGFALGLGRVGRLELAEVRTHGWLRGLVNELRQHASAALDFTANATMRPEGLDGELRDYQARGVEWLKFLTGHGFGALLADDMGLGKTIQTIAWALDCRRQEPTRPILIVAPLTLLANWRHEFRRFAPSLKLYEHQGESRHLASGFRKAVLAADVTLTSYNLLVRDYPGFSEVAWGALVLDEAQAIKNPDTQVARAVRALTPPRRLALTGTPIENSVADLWSIEEFLNPGFLGDRRAFADRFVKPIALEERGPAGRRLRQALEPFVLRRLKSDGRIAAELGEKREIREYCALTSDQRREYEEALETFRTSEHAQGDVFALLTRLKLICDGAGKLERLCELLEQVYATGESALVFTQYAKVGAWLKSELEKRFGRRVPFLHGALSPLAREEEVARFNRRGPSAFILSLKAGGFGLNLTKATHVVHFDRWWNPAVESQATDRAHRIGQTKTVFVHLFICEGTIEERVDEILEKKLSLKELISDGEAFWKAVELGT